MGWKLGICYFYNILMKLPNIWVHVPPGKPNDEVSPKRLQVSDVPIKFQQGEKPLCFGKSMASVLYYIDMKKEVQEAIQKEINKLLNPEDIKMSPGDEREYGGWRGGLTKNKEKNMKKMRLIKKR